MVKLSKTSKMPGASWSLPAIKTCPGAKAENGELVPVCQACYATEGFYVMKAARDVREHNLEDWKRDGWVADMIAELDNHRYFRWFDSGDCYTVALAEKILEVMKATPWVRHWFPTRMAKFAKFKTILETMQALPNVVVRVSSDDLDTVADGAGSMVVTSQDEAQKAGATLCNAPANDGKCGDCRACWSKEVPLVAHMAHGQKMKKVIRLHLAS